MASEIFPGSHPALRFKIAAVGLLLIGACVFLGGCTTPAPTVDVKVVCLPLTDDKALAAASADEIDKAKAAGVPMPNTLALIGRYSGMRDADRACAAGPYDAPAAK